MSLAGDISYVYIFFIEPVALFVSLQHEIPKLIYAPSYSGKLGGGGLRIFQIAYRTVEEYNERERERNFVWFLILINEERNGRVVNYGMVKYGTVCILG